MKRLIAVAVASALVAGSAGPAMAHKAKKRHKPHKPAYSHVQQHPYGYPRRQARRSNDNSAALAFGMLAIGTIAAIAASKSGNAAPAYGYGQAYPPQPYGYGPAGYGQAPGYGYAPPPVVERERERVVEYRREYERERYVGY